MSLIDFCTTQLLARKEGSRKRSTWPIWTLSVAEPCSPGAWGRVWGSGFRVQCPGFRVQGAKGCRVQGAGFRAQGRGFRVSCFTLRLLGVGCRTSGRAVSGVGFRVERIAVTVRVPSGAMVGEGRRRGFVFGVSRFVFRVEREYTGCEYVKVFRLDEVR